MKIRVRHPSIGEAVFLLGSESLVTLGRSGRTAACEFGWDPHISARHARLWLDDGRVWFEDLGSRQGSYLGDRRVEGRIALEPGDRVRIGETWLHIPDELDEWAEPDGPLWAPSGEAAPAAEWTEDRPRQHRRYVTRAPIVVELDNVDEPLRAYMRDASLGGMFIEARRPPPVGTKMSIDVEVQGGTISLDGEVVHSIDVERARVHTIPTGVGIRFNGLEGGSREAWHRYLSTLGAPDEKSRPRRMTPHAYIAPTKPSAWWEPLARMLTPAWERALD